MHCALLVLLAIPSPPVSAQTTVSAPSGDVASFNRALAEATRRMDNAATLALWSDDGVSLLPSTKPMEGKAAIAAFLASMTAMITGAHMDTFDLRCHEIATAADWATEWCTEHQIVRFADGKPPFDGWGKLLLVLHRSSDGHWRIRTEMWNEALPDSAMQR
jgi:ketosteroid isomerase-like protein